MRTMSRNHLKVALASDEGSAILEFVAIAIPLFVPLAFYLTQINQSIHDSFQLHNLARQVARAYVTGADPASAALRADAIFQTARINPRLLGSSGNFLMKIECSSIPCLVPDSEVRATIWDPKSNKSATDTQVVDAWRS